MRQKFSICIAIMTAQPSRLITGDIASDEPGPRLLEFGCPKSFVASKGGLSKVEIVLVKLKVKAGLVTGRRGCANSFRIRQQVPLRTTGCKLAQSNLITVEDMAGGGDET